MPLLAATFRAPRRFAVRHLALLVVAVAALVPGRAAIAAQPPSGTPPVAASSSSASQAERTVSADTPDATRAELTQLLEKTLQRANDAALPKADRSRAEVEVAAIRRRLEDGDFQPGDRMLVTLIADTIRRDQMVVREGPSIDLGAIPELPLKGVLRSEIEAAFHQHLSRYYRSPEVRIQLLTRVAIAGAVAHPGTFSVPPDALLSDVVMAAGGPLPSANPDRISVMRNGREVLSEGAYRKAVKEGQTLERAGILPGDEIRVNERGRHNWLQFATVGMLTVSVFTAVLALIRSSYAE